MGKGGEILTKSNQTPNTDEYCVADRLRGAKVRSRKENSPDQQLRSPSYC